ncbi:hypothetical protein ZIOFF_046444 [Zingiber officinale]|uniref:Uncharacterized protein n=1 Tax=Zingiber officinale TaxID=94328 RepID=A0A8J5FTB2_ZINOF|nr:hypothetical protein ZIOFF_046444 [Zingiber officinale]
MEISSSRPSQFITSIGNGGVSHGNGLPLIESIETGQVIVPERKSWKSLFAYMGPGFLVSIAYIDPGNFETDLQSGAQFKYELLWIILLASCSALVIQSLAAKLGVVTGKHLAEHCRAEYTRVPNFILWILAELAVVACDIPEVIGTAFALNMLFKIPVWCGVLITGLSTLLLLYLQQYGVRKLELLIAFLVFTMAGCFFAELTYAKPKSSEILKGLFVPQLKGNGATGLAISLLGAMVMPSKDLNPEDQQNCNDLDLNKASFLLKNVLGNWSSKLFAVALLASGQSSTITGTYAGQYVMQGFLDLRIPPWIRNLLTRSLAIVPSLIVALIGGSAAAGKLIIISSMILSFELPFALIPLLKFTNSKTKMGSYSNSIGVALLAWLISSLIVIINTYYLVTGFVNLLLDSGLQTVCIVFAGVFGFSAMLIYIAAILYLVFRRNRNSTQPLLQDDANNSVYNLPREDIANMQLPQKRSTQDLD